MGDFVTARDVTEGKSAPRIVPAAELTDAERAAAIRAKVVELLAPVIDYANAQGKLGYVVDFACNRETPDSLRLVEVRIAKVL